ASNRDQQNIGNLWQLAQPLQLAFKSGLFHRDSLFMKTLRRTLNPDQFTRYSSVLQERREFQYRARIELTVASMEGTLPLRQEHRQQFIDLIAKQTKPPTSFGQNDAMYIMWGASQIPEEQIKPLFSEEEWQRMSAILNQTRGMGQWLKQSGMVEDVDNEPADRPAMGALIEVLP
ncbi:MAG: hypothetical protein B7Z55_16090, partial [Planctomycetales bacterium 12-60-4]